MFGKNASSLECIDVALFLFLLPEIQRTKEIAFRKNLFEWNLGEKVRMRGEANGG